MSLRKGEDVIQTDIWTYNDDFRNYDGCERIINRLLNLNQLTHEFRQFIKELLESVNDYDGSLKKKESICIKLQELSPYTNQESTEGKILRYLTKMFELKLGVFETLWIDDNYLDSRINRINEYYHSSKARHIDYMLVCSINTIKQEALPLLERDLQKVEQLMELLTNNPNSEVQEIRYKNHLYAHLVSWLKFLSIVASKYSKYCVKNKAPRLLERIQACKCKIEGYRAYLATPIIVES